MHMLLDNPVEWMSTVTPIIGIAAENTVFVNQLSFPPPLESS